MASAGPHFGDDSVLKVAVIGAGNMGRHHVRVYASMDGVALVGVADLDEATARRAARGYRVEPYGDWRRMLDDERPELVSIAVPTQRHVDVASEVIRRGIHVLIEKPLALTPEEGRSILELARLHGVRLTVGHVERFNPAVIEINRRLGERELGRIFQMTSRRLSPLPLRIEDVGVVLDLATHDIDVMRYLARSEIRRLYAEVERNTDREHDDLLSALLRFENGVIGVLDVNWLTPTKVRQLTVLGEGGMYVADYLTQDLYWYKNGGEPGAWENLGIFRGAREGDVVKVHIAKVEPLRAQLESFVTAVVSDTEPAVTGRDALAALSVAHDLIESARRGQPVAAGSGG